MSESDRPSLADLVAEGRRLDAQARGRWLARLAGRDPATADAVTAALGEMPGAATAIDPDARDGRGEPPTRIGPYRVLAEIGRGGMGVVYHAVREADEFRQDVAVKVVKRGMDTDFILQRFRHERQIVAGLDHPHIARLLDGGSTPDGLPYFVMEYVDGEPIGEYVRRHALSISARLTLFLRVAGAVHHAHQKLVIHRDLKPSNILVTSEGAPKLLDFGIAKLLDSGTESATVESTAPGMRLMTPEYASPEQVRGEMLTTASDVYSLGVILYELLTDRRPYRLPSRRPEDVARVVCAADPVRPSTAVLAPQDGPSPEASTTGPLRPAEAGPGSHRRHGGDRLRRRLEGDLDNIVLKAMAKEPSRRYASADEFAADIRRHLEGRPVTARPDTFFYRSSKFIRRNRAAVAATAMVFVALVAGLVGIAWQARIARTERARAEARFNDVRSLAQSVIFDIHDAIAPLPGSTAARSLLVTRALEYLDRLSSEPEAPPALMRELASAYERLGDVQGRRLTANLGDTSGALASQRKALALRERLLAVSPDEATLHAAVGTSQARIGELLLMQAGTGEAIRSFRLAVAALERARDLGDGSASTVRELSSAYDRLGSAIASGGDITEALAYFRRSNATLEPLASADPDNIELQRSMAVGYHRLGNALGNPNHPNVGDTAGALVELGRARDLLARLHARHPDNAIVRRSLAVVLGNVGDVHMGRKELKASVAANREAQGHFEALARADAANMTARRDVALGQWKRAQLESETGHLDEAVRLAVAAQHEFEELARRDPSSGVAQSDLAVAYSLVGDIWLRRGRPAAALEVFRRMLLIQDALTQVDAANVEMQYGLATVYAQLGQATAAVAATERGVAASQRQANACRWYERARDGFAALDKRGALTGTDATRLDQAERELAACRRTASQM